MLKSVGFIGLIIFFIIISSVEVNAETKATDSSQVQSKRENLPLSNKIKNNEIDKQNVQLVNGSLEQLKQLTSLPLAKGLFEQRKYFTVLKQPIVSTGEVYFDQQLGLIWQTHYPISSVLLLKKSGLYMQDSVTPEREVKGASAITKVLMNALSGNVSALENEFSFKPSKQSACISLLPKENLLANIMQVIDLCLIENKLNRIVLFEHSGNRTEIDLNLSTLNKLPEAIIAQLQ